MRRHREEEPFSSAVFRLLTARGNGAGCWGGRVVYRSPPRRYAVLARAAVKARRALALLNMNDPKARGRREEQREGSRGCGCRAEFPCTHGSLPLAIMAARTAATGCALPSLEKNHSQALRDGDGKGRPKSTHFSNKFEHQPMKETPKIQDIFGVDQRHIG